MYIYTYFFIFIYFWSSIRDAAADGPASGGGSFPTPRRRLAFIVWFKT